MEGDLLGVVLFRPTDDRIEGLKSGEPVVDGCGWVFGDRVQVQDASDS